MDLPFLAHWTKTFVLFMLLLFLFSLVRVCKGEPNETLDVEDVLSSGSAADVCGRSSVRVPKIVGGVEAQQGEFPWLVSIRLNNKHFCGGTLVSNQWILTAAHCVAHWMPRQFSVKLGAYYSGSIPEENAIELPIIRYYVHQYYNVPRPYSNDIALIKIETINFTESISPICLPPDNQDDFEHMKGIVAGWGWLNFGYRSRDSSPKVQKVDLPIISNRVCESWFQENRRPFKVGRTQFCAGYAEGGKDACKGDSGGGLFNRRNDRFQVIGIVSAGFGCAGVKMPGVYTRVNAYLEWIKQNMDNK